MRWPGGNVAQDYRWLWGVGPRDERLTWINLSWKNEPEPGDFGTDEFIQFAAPSAPSPRSRSTSRGAAPRPKRPPRGSNTATARATSKYGAMRAANGHPEPYSVKFWEIGNEIWGNWVRGHSDAETYARNYNRYVRAMRAVDPSLKFIAVGDNDMNWNRTVLARAGADIDYLAIHHYYGRREMEGDRAQPDGAPALLRALLRRGRAARRASWCRAARSSSRSTSGGSTSRRSGSIRWSRRSTARG